ncbi:nucleolar complex protein 4 homolog A [Orussus abietinus]|uniref:nucleolar complex protein 4 homolog A n=1 Tax=Orussus abietinus TaxID=222816 RepID=UPI000625FE19|nr:nucleolar complex protein 4 homolog A [Orussus abietinus]
MAAAVIPGGCSAEKATSKLLRQKTREFLASRKHANNLIDIINYWDEAPTSCILNLEKIFVEILRRGDMYQEQTITLTISDPHPESRYINWLQNCYKEVWDKVLLSIESSYPVVQSQALATALKLIAEEGKAPLEPTGNLEYYFPLHRLKPVLMRLLSPEKDNMDLIARFQEVSSYSDALYYTWKCLPSLTPKRQPQEVYIRNLLHLIHRLPLPKDGEGSESSETCELFCGPQQACGGFVWDQQSAKRALNKVWACIMHWELTPQLHKKLLIVLLEDVMPHLEKPLLMTDFLMDSLDTNGPIGILALHGVFILVTKYNLEYPNIFMKLYSMFEPEIFHTKYKARLFYLSDLFLSSTHLPEALVAAFAKRLARLALVAPVEDILVILLFIGNLLLRHPGLKCLIDCPEGGDSSGDPFLMEERDPLLSNALQSSLWEIKSLQQHCLPCVVTAAQFIEGPLPSVEHNLASALKCPSGQLFEREINKKVEDIMINFERSTSMTLPKGERLLKYWDFMQ